MTALISKESSRTRVSALIGFAGLVFWAACGGKTPAPDPNAEATLFHYKCVQGIEEALLSGSSDRLAQRMTAALKAQKSADSVMSEVKRRLGDDVHIGELENIDGLMPEKTGVVRRVRMVPQDRNKASVIVAIKNTEDGCKLDGVTLD